MNRQLDFWHFIPFFIYSSFPPYWMISWSLTLFFRKNNCGYAWNCSLESEFIEEIVENIWKIVKEEESATAPSRRQHSVPIIPPQNHASSRHDDISEWTPFFFFWKNNQICPFVPQNPVTVVRKSFKYLSTSLSNFE